MAQTAVDVVVRVKDLAALERLKKSLAGVDGATLKATKGINRFENSIKRLQGVLGGLAVGDQLRRAFGAAADFSATEQRLNNITKQYQQLAGIQELAAVSARKFGISTAQASSDLADLGSRLGSSGANLKDLNDIYEGFNTLLAVNAVNSQQAASAQLQLNQALGSGRLAGEEFNAINEATPQLLDEVAKVLGVARGELKQLASDGEISSQVLIEALRNVAENGGDALADFFKTPAGQLKLFDKAIKDFQVTVGQQLLPVFTPIVESLSTLLQLFGQLPGPVKATAVAVTALGAAFAILGGPITAIVAGIIGITLVIKKLADENEAFAVALQGAWNNILAGLEGVGAFFQAFFANISQQAGEFLAYWQGIGNLIAETWNAGIANITEAFGRWQGYFNEVVQAIANAWNQLMGLIPDAFFKAVSALGQIFSPFVDFLNQAFGAISNAWNSLLESMGLNWGTLINEMIAAVLPLTRVFKAMGIDIGESISAGVSAGFKAFSSFQPGEAPSLNLPGVSGLTGVTPPPSGGGGGGGGGGGSGSKAADEAERQAKAIADGLRSSQESLDVMKQQLQVSEAAAGLMRQQEQLELNRLQINQEYDSRMRQALEDNLSDQQKINIELERGLALRKASIDAQEGMMGTAQGEFTDFFKQQPEYAGLFNDELSETQKLLKGSYEIIAGSLTSSLKGLIDGTKEWSDVLSDVLGQLGQMFLKAGLNGLGAGIGIPGFAEGGTIPSNTLALVGEKGPELVTTGNRPMQVYSNEDSQTMMRQSAAMNRYGMVNPETAAPNQPIRVEYQSTAIAGQSYVTEAQFQAGIKQATEQGAKSGETRVYASLRNSRSRRSRLGM